MLEWLKRHAWKACSRLKRLTSSNLVLSATKHSKSKLAVKTATVNEGPPPVESPTFIRAGVLRLRQQPTKKWAVVLILSVLSQGPLRQGAPRCGRPRGGQISSVQTDDIHNILRVLTIFIPSLTHSLKPMGLRKELFQYAQEPYPADRHNRTAG